jgi:hypothetical protein
MLYCADCCQVRVQNVQVLDIEQDFPTVVTEAHNAPVGARPLSVAEAILDKDLWHCVDKGIL